MNEQSTSSEKSSVKVTWNLHPDGKRINALKTKAYRNPKYLAWLRKQKCYSCPAKNDITASHLFRGYHGLKNHDWASVPMCPPCHWEYEYHRDDVYAKKFRIPDGVVAEEYFKRYMKETGAPDDRKPDQLFPI